MHGNEGFQPFPKRTRVTEDNVFRKQTENTVIDKGVSVRKATREVISGIGELPKHMEYLHLWLRDNTQSAEALSSMVKNLWSAQTGLGKNEAIAEGRELYGKIQTHNP